jgi:phosphoglycerol transferase MdoB-like AlkP superfamily enzyme
MLGYYSHDRRFQLTPFLDSLLTESLTFNGMSNSRRSLEVLPSILASIPPMMENDFVRSPYADNDFDAFCQHLQRRGYNTIFMHGGKNGVQGFDDFARRAGFSKYFGRIEYGDDSDYDGQWGIYDGPFLQYAVKTLSRVKEPFATAIYTLSSRYPYKVPKDFELPKESYFWTGFEKTVYYVDCALKDFFTTASQMPWYDRTLFVITSDYSNSEHFQPEYSNVWGMYSIPVAFYYPGKIKAQRCDELAQQIDLGPSILSALEVNDTLFAFGRNLFDTLSEQAFASYYNLTYQYCDGTYLVQSDGDTPFGIFKPISDSLLSDNLLDRLQCPDIYDKLYRFLQVYNNRMISNELKPTIDDLYEQAEDTIHY